MIVLLYVIVAIFVLVLLFVGLMSLRYFRDVSRANYQWNTFVQKRLSDIGSVKQLIITPLIDWYTARESLVGEAGVSYLVQADNTRILLDVGLNRANEHPSPLLRNMKELGVDPKDINYVVISHLHSDHVGGMIGMRKRTFRLSREDVNLSHIVALTPVPMHHVTAQVKLIDEPFVIAPGIASQGPISRALFFLGLTLEQALVVNVAGKGLVIITGCGHQGLYRIVERAEQVISEPLYGIVGGLHYPVTSSRINILGVPGQRLLGTGKLPWRPITRSEVLQSIDYLKAKRLKLVAVSAHDSCDWTLHTFQNAFGEAYQELRVGRPIVV
jgi:7,8-dihydropterin-6-yl-methyl-4-(beta-D-ribofuranosyl)aminobenzene 5'-phosphate synthase